jgi:hypothetical protein
MRDMPESKKAPAPNVCIRELVSKRTTERYAQFAKQRQPIISTLEGMAMKGTFVKEKAPSPKIRTKEPAKVTEVSWWQNAKQSFSSSSTPAGIQMDRNNIQLVKVPSLTTWS